LVDPEIKEIADPLLDLIRTGDCIMWAGSGLSTILEYMDWKLLLRELCHRCKIVPLSNEEENSESSVMYFISRAEDCKKNNRDEYFRLLHTHYGEEKIINRDAYHYLMRLPFKAYLTTNFDPSLKKAGRIQQKTDVNVFPDLNIFKINEGESPIFYIHGLAKKIYDLKNDILVLAESDFEDAYNKGIVSSFLYYILVYKPVIFIGCRLAEPALIESLKRTVNYQKRIYENRPFNPSKKIILLPKLFRKDDSINKIVVPDHTRENQEEKYYRELGIEILRYTKKDEDHSEIEEIFGYINDQIPMKPRKKLDIEYEVLKS